MTRKKKFIPAFLPARLVKGKNRWYIELYQREKRFQLTFSLNRIHNLPLREMRGKEICEKIKKDQSQKILRATKNL